MMMRITSVLTVVIVVANFIALLYQIKVGNETNVRVDILQIKVQQLQQNIQSTKVELSNHIPKVPKIPFSK